MAQFDALIIFPLIWSLVIVLFFYYKISLDIVLPVFAGLNKLREKKVKFSTLVDRSNAVETIVIKNTPSFY